MIWLYKAAKWNSQGLERIYASHFEEKQLPSNEIFVKDF